MTCALHGAVGAERDGACGERFDAGKKRGVEAEAEPGEGEERGRIFRIETGEHACGSARGFRHGFALIEDGDGPAGAGEFESGGETDDAGTGDDGGAILHSVIVGGGSQCTRLCAIGEGLDESVSGGMTVGDYQLGTVQKQGQNSRRLKSNSGGVEIGEETSRLRRGFYAPWMNRR